MPTKRVRSPVVTGESETARTAQYFRVGRRRCIDQGHGGLPPVGGLFRRELGADGCPGQRMHLHPEAPGMPDEGHGVQRAHRFAGRGRVAQQRPDDGRRLRARQDGGLPGEQQAQQRYGLGRQDRQQPQLPAAAGMLSASQDRTTAALR